MTRSILLTFAIAGFAGLGVLDLANGRFSTGVAGVLLAAANYLLLA